MVLGCRITHSSLLYEISAIKWFGSSRVNPLHVVVRVFPGPGELLSSFLDSPSPRPLLGPPCVCPVDLTREYLTRGDVDATSAITFMTLLRQSSWTNVSSIKRRAGAQWLLTSTARWPDSDSSFHSAKSIKHTFMTWSRRPSLSPPMRTFM